MLLSPTSRGRCLLRSPETADDPTNDRFCNSLRLEPLIALEAIEGVLKPVPKTV